MAWKFTEQIRQKLLQALKTAVDQDNSLKNFDELRKELQEKSRDFKYALRSDKRRLEIFQASLSRDFAHYFSFPEIPADAAEKAARASKKLLENLLESIHSDASDKVTSKYNAASIYENLRETVERFPTASARSAPELSKITGAVFDKLVKILRWLLKNSEKVLLEFNRKAFDALLAALDDDRDRAGLQYEEIRQRLIRQFQARGSHKSQTHADEVFNRAARRILEGVQIDRANPFGYFHETARFVLLEYQREVEAELLPSEDLEGLPLDSNSASEKLSLLGERLKNEIGLEAFEKCRAEMSESENLLKDFYDYGDGADRIERRKLLAEELGVEPGTLRKSVTDLNKRLGKCARKKIENHAISRTKKFL